MLKKVADFVNKAFMFVSVILLVVVIISTSIQVFTRYIMNASLSGTDEVARFVFVWMSMLGASICVRTYGHAVVSILNDSLKSKIKLQKSHDIFIQILMLIGAFVLFRYGITLVQMTAKQRSAGLGIPMSYTYACIPVGAFSMLLNGLVNIIEDIKMIKGGNKE